MSTKRDLPELVSVGDLAQACGVTARTVRRWHAAGFLPAGLRFGRRTIRWKKAEIEKFLRQEQTEREGLLSRGGLMM